MLVFEQCRPFIIVKSTDNIRESSIDAGATFYLKYTYKRLRFVFCRKAAHPDAKIDGALNEIRVKT
jgi:hypothetical protein